ncbi:DUF3566 domain-containing protein [Propionicicella superfundia]|uniref:DUF3566 domain-containing protein n=1 Tax=Propionicicella superfundia TaxID=348582 RepID=UPI0004004C75|nr:DUF3566 domain-containing protein [Propionicicella superfundia]
MSDEQGVYRTGGSVGTGTEHLPPANYFRPAPTAKLPGSDAPAAPPASAPAFTPADDPAQTALRPTVKAPPSSSPASTRSPEEVLSAPPSKRTRKARLRLARIDPWSVMKTVFLFSVAGFIISMVAVGVLWTIIEASGLLTDLNEFISTLVSTPSDPTPFDIHQYLNGAKVLGGTAVIGAIDIVLVTALGTLGSFLYNLSATMLGGLELTLAED